MSSSIDRYTPSQLEFDNVGLSQQSSATDRHNGLGKQDFDWSDVQRALWAPPSVKSSRPSGLNRTGELQLPSFEPELLNHQQERLENTVKQALSLHALSLETNLQTAQKFPHVPVLDLFHSPDCKLSHSVLPDGTATTVQTAPCGSTRTQIRSADGTKEAKVLDRYARPVLMESMKPDGSWTVAELKYPDTGGKMSPFVSGKRISHSDGSVEEIDYSWLGKETKRRQYNQHE
jgi:hypothetical protein